MPSEFTREHVAAIAALANLELDPSEVDLFARQLGDILAYADEVRQVDTTGVPPTASVVTRHSVERDDEVGPCLDAGDALAGAPDAVIGSEDDDLNNFFRVPRVIG